MQKIEGYAKSYVTKVLNSIPDSQLRTMKNCVKVGYTPAKLQKRFLIIDSWAQIVYRLFKPPEIGPIEARLGSKREPYYEKESDMIIPEYKLEDLKGDELEIANNIMGKMKQVYMEVVQEDGLLPEGFTLEEYSRKKEIENGEWEEHEKNLQSKKENSSDEHDKD